MKPPWEWDEADLLALITNGVKESIELDYKACDSLAQTDSKKNEVSKDVSAFANSAGGTIVYGMIDNGHVPEKLDSGYEPSLISKEWLDQVINSRIQRRIDGVRINQVELATTSRGKVAYVVNVPQSTRAPHQAADKRFYKRHNFVSVPMEEYEVRDVSLRTEAPDLRLGFQLAVDPSVHQPPTPQMRLTGFITNDGSIPAEYVVISVMIDERLTGLRGGSPFRQFDSVKIVFRGQLYSCTFWRSNWSVPGKMPVLNGVNFGILDDFFSFTIPAPARYLLAWQLNSPRMTQKMDAVVLQWDGGSHQPEFKQA